MIDLPLSDSEGAIENELKNKDGKYKMMRKNILSRKSKNLFFIHIYAQRKVHQSVS